MENKYDILCVANGKKENARLLLHEEKEKYEIKFEMNTLNVSATADNYFFALVELRKKLEPLNIEVLCKGCSRYVYPSPMILSMGEAIEAYQLTMGKQARTKDLVNIFESCEQDEYASVEEQYVYYMEWSKSKKS